MCWWMDHWKLIRVRKSDAYECCPAAFWACFSRCVCLNSSVAVRGAETVFNADAVCPWVETFSVSCWNVPAKCIYCIAFCIFFSFCQQRYSSRKPSRFSFEILESSSAILPRVQHYYSCYVTLSCCWMRRCKRPDSSRKLDFGNRLITRTFWRACIA